MRVLCLDIEGGHGGSSRSLYQSLRHLDRTEIFPEVIVRRGGHIESWYCQIGIPCRVSPELPKVTSLQNWRANVRHYGEAIIATRKAKHTLVALAAEIERRFDVVHFNHEGFWWLATWLRQRTTASITMHIRTMAYPTFMAKFEARQICRVVDSLVFITENERDRFRRLGYKGPGSVIYNIVDPSSCPDTHPSVPNDSRFRIACLSNYSWERGIDRLVDVAAALAGLGRRDILFAIAGDMKLPVNLPGPLGEIGKHGGSLSDFVKQKGLEDMFLFLGHVQNPEQVLVACHLLVKPTRENNPWGRDIIEALAASKSVASVGTYDTFVEDGVTGILQTRFDASELAHRLVSLADNRASCIALGKAGCARVKLLCNGRQCAAALATVWREVYESRHGVG